MFIGRLKSYKREGTKVDLLYVLLLGHALGDFYFQTDVEMKNKKESYISALYHSLKYTVFVALTVLVFFAKGNSSFFADFFLIIIPCIFAPHYIIDLCKTWVYGRKIRSSNLSFFDKVLRFGKKNLFFIDQGLHIALLVVLVVFIGDNFIFFRSLDFLKDVITRFPYPVFPTVLLYVYATKPVGIAIKEFFSNTKSITVELENNSELPRVGFLIGVLERLLLVTFILMGQYAVCAFVLTVKGLARFKELDNRVSAEYYIVGTFLSCVSAFTLKIIFMDFLPYVIL